MKLLYYLFNLFLIIMIPLIIFIKPNINIKDVSTDLVSKSLNSDFIKKMVVSEDLKTEIVLEKVEEPLIVEKKIVEEKEIEEIPVQENNDIVENVSNLENDISENTVDATVITDVLETQVGTMSGYGPDCSGCSGFLGSGFDARNTIYYNDPTYGQVRIVAGDRKYAYGTIVRVNNSKIGTFNAIVLDRGGDIGIGRKYMFDLLFPSEAETYSFGLSRDIVFEILRYGY